MGTGKGWWGEGRGREKSLTRQLNAAIFSEPANRKPNDKQAPAIM